MRLWDKIKSTVPQAGGIVLFYLAQAGFCIKTATGKILVIDPYLSDACERLFGFKRMVPAPLAAEELAPDIYLCTHHHADHLDPDTIPLAAAKRSTFFIGAPDCLASFRAMKIPKSKYAILEAGEQWEKEGIRIRAIFADHGDLAPEAVGYLIDAEGVKIYHAGDTAYRPREIFESLRSDVDIMIAPINGQFGNMIASEACRLAEKIKPRLLIPCHFWMFVEHAAAGGKGDPSTFLAKANKMPESIEAKVMAPGSQLHYIKQTTR